MKKTTKNWCKQVQFMINTQRLLWTRSQGQRHQLWRMLFQLTSGQIPAHKVQIGSSLKRFVHWLYGPWCAQPADYCNRTVGLLKMFVTRQMRHAVCLLDASNNKLQHSARPILAYLYLIWRSRNIHPSWLKFLVFTISMANIIQVVWKFSSYLRAVNLFVPVLHNIVVSPSKLVD